MSIPLGTAYSKAARGNATPLIARGRVLGCVDRLGDVAKLRQLLVPPRVAYTPQIPRLFSEELRGNIPLGLPEDRVDLPGAVRSAVLERGIDDPEGGLDTVVGPRGVKLSGGQQRSNAASRMSSESRGCWSSTISRAASTSRPSRPLGAAVQPPKQHRLCSLPPAAGTLRFRDAKPLGQRSGCMEGKDRAASRDRVQPVGELRFGAGALVQEREGTPVGGEVVGRPALCKRRRALSEGCRLMLVDGSGTP